MDLYKTIFIKTDIVKKSMSMIYEPNGDQLARDVQAAIIEKVTQGFGLFSTTPIQSNYQSVYPHTTGVLLIFKKEA